MTARIIDGKALAATTRAGLVPRIQTLTAAGHPPGLAVILVGEDPGVGRVRPQQGQGVRGDRHPLALHAAAGRDDRGRTARPHRAAERRRGGARHPRAAAAAEAPRRAEDPRDDRLRQGRRRPARDERRPDADGHAALPLVHAVRRDEDAGVDRLPGRRLPRGRARPLEHGRQADGDAAARRQRHRHHRPLEDARPRRRSPARPTCSSPRSAGATS